MPATRRIGVSPVRPQSRMAGRSLRRGQDRLMICIRPAALPAYIPAVAYFNDEHGGRVVVDAVHGPVVALPKSVLVLVTS